MAPCAGDAPGLPVDVPTPLENDSPIQYIAEQNLMSVILTGINFYRDTINNAHHK